MRTSTLLSLALLAAAGCTPGELTYDHTAELGVDSRGVEYTDDESAQVGMNGVTCAVNPDTSNIEEDVDVVDQDDEVADAFDGEALVINTSGVRLYDPMAWNWNDDNSVDIAADGLQSAGFSLGGTVLVDSLDGCNVSFHGESVRTVALGDTACEGAELASSGDTAHVAVVADGHAWLLTADGITADLGPAAHAAIGADGTVFVAGDGLAAVDSTGAELWSTDLDGEVVAVDVIGHHAAVMLAHANGEGELLTFDALGLESSSLRTPSPAQAISASESGRELAMVLPSRIHFFEVNGLD